MILWHKNFSTFPQWQHTVGEPVPCLVFLSDSTPWRNLFLAWCSLSGVLFADALYYSVTCSHSHHSRCILSFIFSDTRSQRLCHLLSLPTPYHRECFMCSTWKRYYTARCCALPYKQHHRWLRSPISLKPQHMGSLHLFSLTAADRESDIISQQHHNMWVVSPLLTITLGMVLPILTNTIPWLLIRKGGPISWPLFVIVYCRTCVPCSYW